MLYADPFLTVYCCLLAALLGACMGSFLNCAAWRIVHGESVLRGRSHCDACGHVLAVRDLIPVVSYLAAHGRCRYCGAKLSRRHVLAEAVSALVFVTLLLHYDISLQTLEGWCVAGILLVCSFADLEGYIIPDRFIAVGVVLFIITLFFAPQPLRRALDGAIGGLAVAGCVLLLVLGMEKLLGREAMGGGDIKLLFLTGLFWAGSGTFCVWWRPASSASCGDSCKKTGRRRGHPVGSQHRPWRLADGAVRPTDHRLVSGAAVILESEDEHFGKDRWL